MKASIFNREPEFTAEQYRMMHNLRARWMAEQHLTSHGQFEELARMARRLAFAKWLQVKGKIYG